MHHSDGDRSADERHIEQSFVRHRNRDLHGDVGIHVPDDHHQHNVDKHGHHVDHDNTDELPQRRAQLTRGSSSDTHDDHQSDFEKHEQHQPQHRPTPDRRRQSSHTRAPLPARMSASTTNTGSSRSSIASTSLASTVTISSSKLNHTGQKSAGAIDAHVFVDKYDQHGRTGVQGWMGT